MMMMIIGSCVVAAGIFAGWTVALLIVFLLILLTQNDYRTTGGKGYMETVFRVFRYTTLNPMTTLKTLSRILSEVKVCPHTHLVFRAYN